MVVIAGMRSSAYSRSRWRPVPGKYTSLQERAQVCAFGMASDIACMERAEREEFVEALHYNVLRKTECGVQHVKWFLVRDVIRKSTSRRQVMCSIPPVETTAVSIAALNGYAIARRKSFSGASGNVCEWSGFPSSTRQGTLAFFHLIDCNHPATQSSAGFRKVVIASPVGHLGGWRRWDAGCGGREHRQTGMNFPVDKRERT
jgi:hypothetical protein